ncbi:MAG TPA: hypothetical protein VLW50_16270 [Streptosporangiaceae bacterium]|nr:hypothetical protein [Streptosporangiaceae bacterium]
MQRSRPGGASRIPVGRGRAVAFAGRISAGGTAVAVVICLIAALIAGVSLSHGARTAAAPEPTRPAPASRPGSRPQPSPAHRIATAIPAELTQAVRHMMSVQQGSAARRDYGTEVTDTPLVQMTRTSADRSWVFGTTVIPVPAGSAAPPWTALFVAHATGGRWDIALSGTPGFVPMLAPATVLTAAEKQLFARFSVVQAPAASGPSAPTVSSAPLTPAPGGRGSASSPVASSSPGGTSPSPGGASRAPAAPGASGLGLPWRAGQSWRLVAAFSGGGSGQTVSMLAFSGGDGRVRAAGPGRLYRFCGGPGSDALIEVIHPDGSATEYYQLRAETRIADGSLVTAGTYLGRAGTSMPCGGTVPGPGPGPARGAGKGTSGRPRTPLPGTVAFAVLGNGGVMNLIGLTLGGWTFHAQAKPPLVWAQRAAVRAMIGGLLVNHGAATPAAVTAAPSPAPSPTPSVGPWPPTS